VADESQAPRAALPAGTQVGRYIIEDVWNRPDAFAIRYTARDSESGERVILKEFFPSEFVTREGREVRPLNEDARRTYHWGLRGFADEAAGLQRIEHPGIVRVLGSLEANGTAYVAVKPIEGQTLAAQLANGRTLAADLLLPLGNALGDALARAHTAGIVHGDVRPENIIVRPDGSPVLIDFAAARFVMRLKCRAIASVLMPGYAAPEGYAANGRFDPVFDIYSLCATMYHATAGTSPPDAQRRARGEAKMKPLSKATLAWYPPGVLEAIEWGLRLDPAARPQTVAEWRDALAGKITPPADTSVQPEAAPEADKAAAAKAATARPAAAEANAASAMPEMTAPPAKNGTFGIVAAVLAVVVAGGVYFATRSKTPQTENAPQLAGEEVPEMQQQASTASAAKPAAAAPSASEARIVALDHLANELKSREAQADAAATAAREQTAKAVQAAKAAGDAAERARLQKEADEAAERERLAREEAARVKAEAEDARRKKEQEMLAAQQQAQQLARQQAAQQRPAQQSAAQLQLAQQPQQQTRIQDLNQQLSALSGRTRPLPGGAPPSATQPSPSKPAASVSTAAPVAAPSSGGSLADIVAMARKNCRLAAPDLTTSGDLTYEKAKTMPGASVDPDSGAVQLQPMTLKDGRFQAVKITPDNCAKIVRM
jgi:hypothetical protein